MSLPIDARNFDKLGATSTTSALNTAFGNISYYITQLQDEFDDVAFAVSAGESLDENDFVYVDPSDSKMYAIDIDATPVKISSIRGVVDANGDFQYAGLKDGFTGLTPFLPVYADSSGAGTYTQTEPVPVLGGSQVAIVQMGIAISETQILIDPQPVIYAKKSAMAQNDTLTVQHHSDENGFTRQIQATQNWAYYSQTYYAIYNGISGATGVALKDITDGYDRLMQLFAPLEFTPGLPAESFLMGQIIIGLRKVGSPTGTLTVRIETLDANAEPTGTLVDPNATATYDEADLPTSFEEVSFPVSEFTLPAGTYALILSSDRSESDTDYVEWATNTTGYKYGYFSTEDGGVWTAMDSADGSFQIVPANIIEPHKLKLDWWDSSNAEMVNRYGDGAGSDLNTKTTIKCLAVAGFDIITLEVILE